MKYPHRFIIISAFMLILAGTSFAGPRPHKSVSKEFKKDDFVFSIKSAVMVESPDGAQRILGLRYNFVNLNETRKIELVDPFIFQLKDEFGNYYRQVAKPENYTETRDLPSNFPSVYPNEEMEEIVFFEPPIERSRFLTLSIDAKNVGLRDPVSLQVTTDKIRNPARNVSDASRSAMDVHEETEEHVRSVPVRIVTPSSGAKVAPGERITVQVKFEDEAVRPNMLMLIIPDYVLEDSNAHGTYDLIIPQGQAEDFSLVVIAKWYKGDSEELTSDSVLLNVVDPSVL